MVWVAQWRVPKTWFLSPNSATKTAPNEIKKSLTLRSLNGLQCQLAGGLTGQTAQQRMNGRKFPARSLGGEPRGLRLCHWPATIGQSVTTQSVHVRLQSDPRACLLRAIGGTSQALNLAGSS